MNKKKTSYKLMSLDMDGTFLSPVLRRAKKADCLAVQEFMALGGKAFINTGRSPWAIANIIKRINKFGDNRIRFISCWNGSYIKDFNDGTTLISKISHEYCKKLYDIVSNFKGASVWFCTLRGLQKHQIEIYPASWFFRTFYPLAKVVKIQDMKDLSSFKVDILSTSKSTIAKIYHELIKNNLHQVLTISHSSNRLIEVTPKNINKGYAIKYFAKKYKILKHEIVSMGDSFNDASAFESSALSIGINPRNPGLLEYCDTIVNHKSKGVSEAIETYVIKDAVNSHKFKLIFSDLDGTLIDSKTKLFSSQTKIALQQCTNHLIPIAIASGRGIYDGMQIVKAMQLNPKTNIYIIGNNGATIFDIYTNKYISQSPIDDSDAKQVFEYAANLSKKLKGHLGFIIHQHSSDLLFYNKEFWKPINFKKTGFEDRYDPWVAKKPVYVSQYPNDIICYKYVIKFPDHKSAIKGRDELRAKFPNLEICLSSDVNVEVNKKNINKGFAVKKLSELIKVDNDNVLVLGDGQNDIPALKACKNSFTPHYSPSFVQKEAKYVIKDVDVANFVSTVIYKYVLKKQNQGK